MEAKNQKITVSLTGGLGNQLFQIAAGLHHSSGHGISVIDSLGNPRRTPSGVASALQFDFNNQLRQVPIKNLSKFWVKCAGYVLRRGVQVKNYEKLFGFGTFIEFIIKMLLMVKLKCRYRIVRATGVGDTVMELSKSKCLFLGYFQTDRWLSDPYVMSTLQAISISGSEQLLEVFRVKADQENPLIIHFRIGDYKFEPEIGLLSTDYYHRALSNITRFQNVKKIWLFSDEPQIAFSKIPEALKPLTEIIQIPENNDALTLQVMRFGKSYILSNSTFGWWSARLSHTNNPIVLIPDRWFKALPEPNGLVPKEWLRIQAWD